MATDRDYLGMTGLMAGDAITAVTTPLDDAEFNTPDTQLGLFDAQGVLLAMNDDTINDDEDPVAGAPLIQHRNRGQRFAFQVLKKGATTGTCIRDLIGDPVFLQRGQRIPAAGDAERRTFRDGVRHALGPGSELVYFEYADRPVPDNRARIHQHGGIMFRRLRTDIEDHLVGFDVLGPAHLGRGRLTHLTGDNDIRGHRDVGSGGQQGLRLADKVRLEQRFADSKAGCRNKRVRNTAAHDQLIDSVH